jgi:hypothetical protein
LRGAGPIAAIMSASLFAVLPQVVANSVSGMVTPLYNALMALAFWLATRERPVALGLTFGALLLCRPDGLAAVGFAGLLALLSSPRKAVGAGLIGAAVFSPWAIFAGLTFGSVIPSSVTAKAASHEEYQRWLSLNNFSTYFGNGLMLILSALALVGAVWIISKGSRTLKLWLGWWLAYAMAFILSNAFTHYPWYFVPLLPLYFVAIAIAVEQGVLLIERLVTARWPIRRWSGLQGGLLVLCALVLMQRVVAQKKYQQRITKGREALYASTARDLAAKDPRCTLAATEIGALGYFYPGKILDLVGLVSPEVIGKPQAEATIRSDARWLVTYDTHFQATPEFAATFEKISTTAVKADRNLDVYERKGAVACNGSTRR